MLLQLQPLEVEIHATLCKIGVEKEAYSEILPSSVSMIFTLFRERKASFVAETGFLGGQASGGAHSDNDSALINAGEPFWQLLQRER